MLICLTAWVYENTQCILELTSITLTLTRAKVRINILSFVLFPIQTNSNWPFHGIACPEQIDRVRRVESVFSLNLHQITFLIVSHYRFTQIKVNFKFFVCLEYSCAANTLSTTLFCLFLHRDTDTVGWICSNCVSGFQVNKCKLNGNWTWEKTPECGLSTQTKTAGGQINFEVKTLPSFVIEQCANVSRKCHQHAR